MNDDHRDQKNSMKGIMVTPLKLFSDIYTGMKRQLMWQTMVL